MTMLLNLHYDKQCCLLEVEGPFQTVLSKKNEPFKSAGICSIKTLKLNRYFFQILL